MKQPVPNLPKKLRKVKKINGDDEKMKFGGSTGNSNHNGRPMPRNFKCSNCGRSYALVWARDNHEKLCIENKKSKEMK